MAWPPTQGLGTPTSPRESAVLTLSESVHINAPAALVFDALLDVSKYGEWNTWCPKVTIETPPGSKILATGTIFNFHVIMDAAKPTKETPTRLIVTDVSTPEKPSSYIPTTALEHDPSYTTDLSSLYRISWKGEGGFATKGLRSERFHEVIINGEDSCEVRTWEVMSGPLAYTVRWVYKRTLNEKFALWCTDLKKRCDTATRT